MSTLNPSKENHSRSSLRNAPTRRLLKPLSALNSPSLLNALPAFHHRAIAQQLT